MVVVLLYKHGGQRCAQFVGDLSVLLHAEVQHVLVLELVDAAPLVRVALFILGVLAGGADARHQVALRIYLRRLHDCVVVYHHVDVLVVHVA